PALSLVVTPTRIPDVRRVEPVVHGDARGFFTETYRENLYRDHGIDSSFVQDNLSFSRGNVIRGLHVQNPSSQAKLVYVLQGEVFDVAVDVRGGSPTFGHWVGEVLSADNHRQLFIPQGFAHGFAVLSETVLFAYKCSDYYDSGAEFTVRWDDPDVGIEWPLSDPILSEKDLRGSRLRDIDTERLRFPDLPAV
ncbi:MAG TPA: dTDP-4-dehydrorhamnose 3,5-epimerase, partial [Fimbriimonas sp.]